MQQKQKYTKQEMQTQQMEVIQACQDPELRQLLEECESIRNKISQIKDLIKKQTGGQINKLAQDEKQEKQKKQVKGEIQKSLTGEREQLKTQLKSVQQAIRNYNKRQQGAIKTYTLKCDLAILQKEFLPPALEDIQKGQFNKLDASIVAQTCQLRGYKLLDIARQYSTNGQINEDDKIFLSILKLLSSLTDRSYFEGLIAAEETKKKYSDMLDVIGAQSKFLQFLDTKSSIVKNIQVGIKDELIAKLILKLKGVIIQQSQEFFLNQLRQKNKVDIAKMLQGNIVQLKKTYDYDFSQTQEKVVTQALPLLGIGYGMQELGAPIAITLFTLVRGEDGRVFLSDISNYKFHEQQKTQLIELKPDETGQLFLVYDTFRVINAKSSIFKAPFNLKGNQDFIQALNNDPSVNLFELLHATLPQYTLQGGEIPGTLLSDQYKKLNGMAKKLLLFPGMFFQGNQKHAGIANFLNAEVSVMILHIEAMTTEMLYIRENAIKQQSQVN